jgi:hypothetical protein
MFLQGDQQIISSTLVCKVLCQQKFGTLSDGKANVSDTVAEIMRKTTEI